METPAAATDWAEQAAPIAPTSSGKRRSCGERIVRALHQAESALDTAMAHAHRTGDVVVGFISEVGSRAKWHYEVTCVSYDPAGISAAELLARLRRDEPIELAVTREYVTSSSISGVAYRKRGTWKIRCEYLDQG